MKYNEAFLIPTWVRIFICLTACVCVFTTILTSFVSTVSPYQAFLVLSFSALAFAYALNYPKK